MKSIATEPFFQDAHCALIGEEIWWAGQEVDGLTVKISVADSAGHRTTKTFSMLPADPNVSQADLASEIIAPPLPSPLAKSKRQTKSVVVKNSNSETKLQGQIGNQLWQFVVKRRAYRQNSTIASTSRNYWQE